MTLSDNVTGTMVNPQCCAISKGFEKEMSDFNHEINPHAAAALASLQTREPGGMPR